MRILFKNICFLLTLFISVQLVDGLVQKNITQKFQDGYFPINSYDITKRDNKEEVWDKVFFGNSVVMGGYREDISLSGYINFGMEYATFEDLLAILKQGDVVIGDELVAGITLLSCYDDLETNDSYLFNKKNYEPFTYYYRDKIKLIIEESADVLFGADEVVPIYGDMIKNVREGSIGQEKILEKIDEYEEKYWNLTEDDFSNNLKALEEVSKYCKDNNINFRCVLMPINSVYGEKEVETKVYDSIKSIALEEDFELLDLTDLLEEDEFYDLVHLSYDSGAIRFTNEIDSWLIK